MQSNTLVAKVDSKRCLLEIGWMHSDCTYETLFKKTANSFMLCSLTSLKAVAKVLNDLKFASKIPFATKIKIPSKVPSWLQTYIFHVYFPDRH